MMSRVFIGLAIFFAATQSFAGALSGTASYRERIALPPQATFMAILYDISNNRQVQIGRFAGPGGSGPPYVFTIEFADNAVTDTGLYALKTQVILQDRLFLAAGTILENYPAKTPDIDLVMVRPGVDQSNQATERLSPVIGAHGLARPATYHGVVVGNGGAETWRLALATDQTFQLSRTFESSQRDSLGRWAAEPTAGTLVLRDGAEMPIVIRPTASGELRVVDANTGEDVVGELTRAADDALELSGMMMGGMMTYMADAAIFEDCVSGAVFPVAQEGDYLALEQAYLADRAAPGAPLYVTLEGGLAMRPNMEGPDRQMVIVDRFIRTQPEAACERHMADANLQNTFWRLDVLEGADFPPNLETREPHLVLETTESGSYRATVGCNRMRGSYTRDGQQLGFAPAASTLMACPEPLNALERQFGLALSETADFRIEGDTLILRDANGKPKAIFSAVYF